MNSINMAFLLTTLAGLTTILGLIPIFIPIKNEEKIIAISLAFASGVMLCVSITDLIPESIKLLEENLNGFSTCLITFTFVLIGIYLSSFIDDKINNQKNNTTLYKIGIISMMVIILHNIPEGIATFISTTKNTSLGISLTIAIALHNIPEGISIGVPIYYSTKSKIKAITYTIISALSEPFGALLTYLFLLPFINNIVLACLFSLIAGIMIEIPMTELLPTSYKYGYIKISNAFFIIGVVLMLIKFII